MTIKELLLKSTARRKDNVAIRYKRRGRWREISYGELLRRTRRVCQVLAGLRVKPGDNVAIYLDNCPEWPEIYFGIVAMGATAVPVDAKLGEQEAVHVLRHAECCAVFASAKTYHVIREMEDHLPLMGKAILLGGAEIMPESSRRIRYLDYAEALAETAEAAAAEDCCFNVHGPGETDVASIIYTSGTTGRQKGAMLTHRNFCSNVEACLKLIEFRSDDNFLLALPLHHSFAFTANLLLPIASGAEISFVESLRTLGENMREVSPTVLIAVPLLIEKMYARVREGLRRNRMAYLLYRMHVRKPVLKGISAKLGGRLRLIVSGAAPADPDVLNGFRDLGFPILEGYGLTETAPVLTINPLGSPKPGTVGKAVPGVKIRIVGPNAEGVGEIAAKGANVMQGYYKDIEATAAAFDDGWFLTGDLGYIEDDGYITITGRKKSLIVNREGKNIHPEEVESAICSSEFILEAVVLGYTMPGTTGERVGVIVVPDQDAIDGYAKRKRTAVTDELVSDLMRREVKSSAQGIAEYKHPRRVQIRTEKFERTSTGKIKRYLYAISPTEV